MNFPNSNFTSIEQVTGQYLNQKTEKQTTAKTTGISFEQVLKNKSIAQTLEEQRTAGSGELKFSRHANERLSSRNIDLSEEQMERLQDGAERARQKGIRESLIVVDNLAFIVNIKNNTVVTAVGDREDKIFTNIDGAVIN